MSENKGGGAKQALLGAIGARLHNCHIGHKHIHTYKHTYGRNGKQIFNLRFAPKRIQIQLRIITKVRKNRRFVSINTHVCIQVFLNA